MKKLLFTLFALICTMSINAQVIKVMKGDVVVDTYTAEEADQVLFVEPLTPVAGALTFTANEPSTIKINLSDTQYRTNYQDWTDYTADTEIALKEGEFVQFKAASSSTRQDLGFNSFVMTGSLNASDNIMSLLGAGQPLGVSAFRGLFENCASLKTAPELPATTMANFCYMQMFSGCTGLTAAPALPATALANSCYDGMFQGCTNLTSVPATLSATVLKDRCYSSMFEGCTSLETAPAISGTTLAQSCCYRMFHSCTSLTTAPATLPATVLANACYQTMFYGCTSLTTAPVLPATSLVSYCYNNMFGGCTNLSSMDVAFTSWSSTDAVSWWLDGVSATGTFKCPLALPEQRSASKIPEGWTIDKPTPLTPDAGYITFTALQDNSTIKIALGDLEYKTTTQDWTDYTSNAVITLQNTQFIQFRTKDSSTRTTVGKTFGMSGSFNVSDNLMSLLKTGQAMTFNAFRVLFQNCGALKSAENLVLPTSGLANFCYQLMFNNCTNLTTAPVIPASATYPNACFDTMFKGCSNLSYVEVNFTAWPTDYKTNNWLSGVKATGTFKCPSSLPNNTGADYIPTGWTRVNK